MVLIIVLVNLLVAVVVFGVCILRQVLKLRKEVEEAFQMVLELKSRAAYTETYTGAGGSGVVRVGDTAVEMFGGSGGRWVRSGGAGGQGGRGILSYKWED